MAASLPSFPAPVSLSPLGHTPDYTGWEYEGLIHAQTHLTAEYRRHAVDQTHLTAEYKRHAVDEATLPETHLTAEYRRRAVDEATLPEREDFADRAGSWLDDFVGDNYFESWDKHLLNMDDQLNTLPPFGVYEHEAGSAETNNRTCCPQVKSSNNDAFAFIVSHVHGGEKVVSCGKFSAHAHIGGGLYDTPTCMGSCGAPIIALGSGDAPAYVSHLVHAGTGRVNGVHAGIGVAHFDDGLAVEQTRNVCNNRAMLK